MVKKTLKLSFFDEKRRMSRNKSNDDQVRSVLKTRFGEDSSVKMHADSVIMFDWIVEKTFHESMSAQRLLYFALNHYKDTLSPRRVRTSTGLKYFTSLGLKNINLTVDRRL